VSDDKVEFEVLEEVQVADILVIPKGGIAWGTITEAQPKRRMARKLDSQCPVSRNFLGFQTAENSL
jgi:hypothetical protein